MCAKVSRTVLKAGEAGGPASPSQRAGQGVTSRPNRALHRTRPPDLFLIAHLAYQPHTGVAAGPVSLFVMRL